MINRNDVIDDHKVYECNETNDCDSIEFKNEGDGFEPDLIKLAFSN